MIFVSPVNEHSPTDPKPPGIEVDSWCYATSTSSLLELQTLVTNLAATGLLVTSVRTPAIGSNVTYVAMTDAQRTAALAEDDVFPAPSEGKARAKSFDAPATSWEPG